MVKRFEAEGAAKMAQLLTLRHPFTAVRSSSSIRSDSATSSCCRKTLNPNWASLQQKLKCNGRFSCLFSGNRKQEEARKALESALGGKKDEFEKWNKEIKKREDMGGGEAGGGGWFGWGGRFGWSNDDHFWEEAQQASLAMLGIILMYLIIAKGEVLLAVIFNPLLFALRGTRNSFNFIISRVLQKASPASLARLNDNMLKKDVYAPVSAKESVVRKWGGE